MKILILGGNIRLMSILLELLSRHQILCAADDISSVSGKDIAALKAREKNFIDTFVQKSPPQNPAICAKNCRKLKTRGRTK